MTPLTPVQSQINEKSILVTVAQPLASRVGLAKHGSIDPPLRRSKSLC